MKKIRNKFEPQAQKNEQRLTKHNNFKNIETNVIFSNFRSDVIETHGFVPLCSRHRPFVTSLGHYVPAFGQVVRTGDVSLCECSQHV